MSRYAQNQSSRTSSKGDAPSLLCQICGESVAIGTAKTDGDGKAVHEECYAAKIKSERASAGPCGPAIRPWKVVAEEASRERDPKKMSALVEELNQALDRQKLDQTQKAASDGTTKPARKP